MFGLTKKNADIISFRDTDADAIIFVVFAQLIPFLTAPETFLIELSRLPKSFMAENTVFLLLTALIHNFYKTIMSRLDTKAFGLKETSRIKAFVFSFISVPAKWIMTARQYVLNIYTENRAYVRPFKTGFG